MSTTTLSKPGGTPQPTISSGNALMSWRKQAGISRRLFAQMADFSERKLATYEAEAKLPQKVKRPVMETVRLIQALQELAGEESDLKAWLMRPNSAFGETTPLALISEGQSDLLWEMVYQIRQGAFA